MGFSQTAIDSNLWVGETTIHTNLNNGEMWVSAFPGGTPPRQAPTAIGLWTSINGGKNFSFVSLPNTNSSFLRGDNDAIIDSSGRIHVAAMFGGWKIPGPLNFGCLVYWRSLDDGKTFSTSTIFYNGTARNGTPPAACAGISVSRSNTPSTGWLSDLPFIASYKDNIYVAWTCLTGKCVSISRDGGQTWALLVTAIPTSECNCNVTSEGLPARGYIAVDQNSGTIYIPYIPIQTGQISTTNTLKVAISNDGGKTFTYHVVARISEAQQNIPLLFGGIVFPVALDSAGDVYVAWSDNSQGPFNIFLSVSTNGGASWSSPTVVNNVGQGIFEDPWLVAGDKGNVALDWWGTTDALGPPMVSNSTRWYLYAAISTNALDPIPSFTETKVSTTPFFVGGGPSQPPNDTYQVGMDAQGHAIIVWPNLAATSQGAHSTFPYNCVDVEQHIAYGECGPLMFSIESTGPSLLTTATTTSSSSTTSTTSSTSTSTTSQTTSSTTQTSSAASSSTTTSSSSSSTTSTQSTTSLTTSQPSTTTSSLTSSLTTTTTSTASTSPTSSSSSSATSSPSGGGIPEFPSQSTLVAAFTIITVVSYLTLRHRKTP